MCVLMRFLFRYLGLPGLIVLIFSSGSSGQTFDLKDYLTLRPGETSSLAAEAGFTLTFVAASDTDFHWAASHPEEEGLRHHFRLDASGLALLMEQGVTPDGNIVYTETYEPRWSIAPASVGTGQIVSSEAEFTGLEFGEGWDGSAEGMFTVGNLEEVTTPAGTFQAYKLTFESDWDETGASYSADGTTTQTWWVVEERGVVRLDYAFTERHTEDGETEREEGELSFLLVASELLQGPSIVAQPVSISVAEGGSVTFSIEATGPGNLRYQWLKNGVPIEGEETPFLTIEDVQLADDGAYTVTVSNLNDSIVSEQATLSVEAPSPPVTIPDQHLAEAVDEQIEEIGGLVDDKRTAQEMAQLITLEVTDRQVATLVGLESATNLKDLDANENDISDLTPISGLTQLTILRLARNNIDNLEPLADLDNLRVLQLNGNAIANLSALGALTNLEDESMHTNRMPHRITLSMIRNQGPRILKPRTQSLVGNNTGFRM